MFPEWVRTQKKSILRYNHEYLSQFPVFFLNSSSVKFFTRRRTLSWNLVSIERSAGIENHFPSHDIKTPLSLPTIINTIITISQEREVHFHRLKIVIISPIRGACNRVMCLTRKPCHLIRKFELNTSLQYGVLLLTAIISYTILRTTGPKSTIEISKWSSLFR